MYRYAGRYSVIFSSMYYEHFHQNNSTGRTSRSIITGIGGRGNIPASNYLNVVIVGVKLQRFALTGFTSLVIVLEGFDVFKLSPNHLLPLFTCLVAYCQYGKWLIMRAGFI